jgi:tRNA(Ile)-lysidine synthase
LLGLRRSETRALCQSEGLTPVEDPTNVDQRFRRNHVRHALLPLLDAIAERDVAAVIATQAGRLGDEADLLDELAAAIDPTDARALRDAPTALARRAVRLWLRTATGAEHPVDADSVERVLTVARGDAVACEVAGGWRVSRSMQHLEVTLSLTPTRPRHP